MSKEEQQRANNSISFNVRQATLKDVATCAQIWSQVEKFAPSKFLIATRLALDARGFCVAHSSSGEDALIGVCSTCFVSAECAVVGLFAVLPEFQACGVGRALWAQSTREARAANANIGLFAVAKMRDKYAASGFAIADNFAVQLYEARVGNLAALRTNYSKFITDDDDDDDDDSNNELANVRLVLITQETQERLVDKLIEFDTSVVKTSRGALLKSYIWRASDDEVAALGFERPIVVVAVHSSDADDDDDDERVVAYGCVSVDGDVKEAHVEQVYANSPRLFELILAGLLEQCKPFVGDDDDEFVVQMYASTTNAGVKEPLEALGFNALPNSNCQRLFTNYALEVDESKVYSILSSDFALA